jgi:hypothetical protein
MAESTTTVVPPLALDGTLGAIEIGTMVSTWLFGLLTHQTFKYWRQFKEDPISLKITVRIFISRRLNDPHSLLG